MAIFYLILMPLPHVISLWPSAVRRSPQGLNMGEEACELVCAHNPRSQYFLLSRNTRRHKPLQPSPPRMPATEGMTKMRCGCFFFFWRLAVRACRDAAPAGERPGAVRGGGHQVAAQCGLTPRLPHWPRRPEPSAGPG